jgi:hypothetical protein
MRTTLWLAAALPLLSAGCFSPSYHDGNLNCTASGECPKDYHCAVDHTCWRNGSDPDALPPPADTAGPEAATAPDIGADGRDAAPDNPPTTDLPAGIEVAVTDLQSPTDTPTDVPLAQDLPVTDTQLPDAEDAPVADAQASGLDGGHGEAGSAGVALADLAAAYAKVVCARNFACCTQADLTGKSLQTCESNLTSTFQVAVQQVADGVGRGRTLYYPERASQCLQLIAEVACQDWPIYDPASWLPAICENTIEPQVTAGGACRSAFECVSGLCTGASSSKDGACLPKAGSGQSCVFIVGQNSCESGLFCDNNAGSICAATKPEGESCASSRDCKSQTCGAAPDAGNVCLPQLCYSNGPLVSPACSLGGRPSAFAGGFLLAALGLLMRRRHLRRRRG